MRPAELHQSVADSLQADVMRFMAIIAFCLIAILALVRGAAPPADPAAAAVERPAPQAVANREPGTPATAVSEPAPVRRQPIEPAPEASPSPPAAAEPQPAFEPPVSRPAPDSAPRPSREVAAARPDVVAEPAPSPATASESAEQEGLSLRFASEQDFLRLVTRGRIQVFAFDGDRVLALGSNFSFEPAAAPGEVHELLPETIPALMTGALTDTHGGGFRWGVTMPDAMARKIRRFVAEGATGELIIDRFGEVRHHGA